MILFAQNRSPKAELQCGPASYIGGKSCYTYKMGKIHDLITLKGYSLKTMHSRFIKVYIF